MLVIDKFLSQKARASEFDAEDLVCVRSLVNSWLILPIAKNLWPGIRINCSSDFVDYVESKFEYQIYPDSSAKETY